MSGSSSKYFSQLLPDFDESKRSAMNGVPLCQRTFLPGDGRPRGPGGLAVQDDRRAVDHGAVGGAGRDVRGDT